MSGFKRILLFFLLAGFGLSCSKANSNAKRSIKIPNFDEFTECKNIGKATNSNADIYTCNLKKVQVNKYEIEDSKYNFSYVLIKSIDEDNDFKAFIMQELAYDCKNKESITRDIKIKATYKGKDDTDRLIKTIGFNNNWKTQKNYTKDDNIFLHKSICPAEKGYTKIGTMQVDLKNIMRRGSMRNISTYDSWNDYKYTTTVDCRKLLYGIDTSPDTPIRPESFADILYKKVCK